MLSGMHIQCMSGTPIRLKWGFMARNSFMTSKLISNPDPKHQILQMARRFIKLQTLWDLTTPTNNNMKFKDKTQDLTTYHDKNRVLNSNKSPEECYNKGWWLSCWILTHFFFFLPSMASKNTEKGLNKGGRGLGFLRSQGGWGWARPSLFIPLNREQNPEIRFIICQLRVVAIHCHGVAT